MANQYIRKRGNKYVVLNKSGKVLSQHDTREQALASFRAIEMNKHAGRTFTREINGHKYKVHLINTRTQT